MQLSKSAKLKDLERYLVDNGFEVQRQTGGHRIYKHVTTGRLVTVSQSVKLQKRIRIWRNTLLRVQRAVEMANEVSK